MNVKSFSTARLILFLLGEVVLGLAIWFAVPSIFWKIGVVSFLIVTALVVYVALLLPLVFSFEVTDGVFVGGAIYYRGAVILSVLSVLLMRIVLLSHRVTPFYVVLELAAIIVFVGYILFSYTAASHTHEVQSMEEQKKGTLNLLKQKAVELQMIVDRSESDDKVKSNVKKLAENIRFLSPSDNPEARRLEDALIEKIVMLDLNNIAASDLKELDFLYRQRKSIY